MTDEELSEIRARVEAASDGPWSADDEGDGGSILDAFGGHVVIGNGVVIDRVGRPAYGVGSPDADFIAHSREDVPALLAEVERLRAREAAARIDLHVALEEVRRLAPELAAAMEIVRAVAHARPILRPHPQVIDVPVLYSIWDDLVEVYEKARILVGDS